MFEVLFHLVVFGEQFNAGFEMMGFRPSAPLLGLCYAILVAGMIYLYPRMVRVGSPLADGYRFGAVIGLIFIVPVGVLLASGGMATWLVSVDTVHHVFIQHAIPGAIIAIILARGQEPGAGRAS